MAAVAAVVARSALGSLPAGAALRELGTFAALAPLLVQPPRLDPNSTSEV